MLRFVNLTASGLLAGSLGFGNDVQGECRLAGTFRSIDFDDAAARHAANANRRVQRQRGRGDRRDIGNLTLA